MEIGPGFFFWEVCMAHRRGESRSKTALFPVMLDELVGEQSMRAWYFANFARLHLTM